MNLALPKNRPFTSVLAAAGRPLNEEEPANDAATLPARKAPTQDDLKAFQDQTQQEANLKALDQRGAAAMNFLKLCATQRQQPDYTDEDFADFRGIMAHGDHIVTGSGEISRGFGEPLRVRLDAQVQEALDKVAAMLAAPEAEAPASDAPQSSNEAAG